MTFRAENLCAGDRANGSSCIATSTKPTRENVGDCTVRAISKATGKEWGETYFAMAIEGYLEGDMPSANAVWGAYLRRIGYKRYMVPDTCPDCYTVGKFADEHPEGTFILALSGHVVCVQDGVIYDSWNSENEIVLYYWQKKVRRNYGI